MSRAPDSVAVATGVFYREYVEAGVAPFMAETAAMQVTFMLLEDGCIKKSLNAKAEASASLVPLGAASVATPGSPAALDEAGYSAT